MVSMKGLKAALLCEEKRLKNLINEAEKEVRSSLEGKLRISKCKENYRFYHCTDTNNGVYISASNVELPKQLAQKTYNIAVAKKARIRLKQIAKILRDYTDDEIEKLYTSLHKERQKLIVPLEPTWEQMVEKWYTESYQGKEFAEGTPVILTDKGERVRSKSEKILADFFCKNNILYKYEKPLYLNGYGMVYPDFTFLSPKTGREIYWEHEGMMDKPEYARAAVQKIESYQKNGIYQGEQLILTFETERSVLNSQIVESLTKKYLLC